MCLTFSSGVLIISKDNSHAAWEWCDELVEFKLGVIQC